jgi:N-acetyl-alpha-D-muramate 1-phosphate uridylyltransferase
MILAAGEGTRLRPLTDHLPKALIDVGGIPMLERVARRLIEAGADRLIINVHYLGEKIRWFVEERQGFGVEVLISDEPGRRLETGGGLKHAARFFRRKEPFLMHNADILTDIDLHGLYEDHRASGALATLAVKAAETPRYLVEDADGRICGYGNAASGTEYLAIEPTGPVQRVDFCGVQALSPRIFDLMTETGVFSIIDVYMRLSREGEVVRSHRVDDALWIDIGSHERLEQARRNF